MENTKNDRKILFKKEMKVVPFCSVCDKEIIGNGSMVAPYRCECGMWSYNTQSMKYEVKLPVVN